MLFLLSSAPALATAMGPYPVLSATDDDCQPAEIITEDLHITYQAQSQSCVPGGPCSIIGDDPLDAGELWVEVEGCVAELAGAFVQTHRQCEGRPVWRFTGSLPTGHRVRIVAPEISLGWLGVAGAQAALQCRPEPPVRVRSAVVTHEHPPQQGMRFPAEDIQVTEGDSGWTVSWDSRKHFPTLLPDDNKILSAVTPEQPSIPEGPYLLQTRYIRTTTEYEQGRRLWCEIGLDMISTMRVGAVSLESTAHTRQRLEMPCP